LVALGVVGRWSLWHTGFGHSFRQCMAVNSMANEAQSDLCRWMVSRVAVADVPFVDVVTTISDASIPLTVTEWEEW
jgi:hypothetical protein